MSLDRRKRMIDAVNASSSNLGLYERLRKACPELSDGDFLELYAQAREYAQKQGLSWAG